MQFNKDFTFADAAPLASYLADLGISHLYSSPILTARASSMHGYDVIDHSRINPELGGEEGFRLLAQALRVYDIGIVLDIVPNHMAVGGADNLYWLDVLENGRDSVFANMFDIDWEPAQPNLRDKILVPLLGSKPQEALDKGEISLIWDEKLGKYAFAYAEHRFPLRTEDYALVENNLEAENKAAQMKALLEKQNFRLAWWRDAGQRINWRRFFDITGLAALRIEDDAVFEIVHTTTFRLYAEGLIDGVRVDHVDGLANPKAYCLKLRARLEALNMQRERKDPPYIVVEKILATDEQLPADWRCDGTTGYDFMNQISALQHNERSANQLAKLWADISGRSIEFGPEERLARSEVLESAFAGQLRSTAAAFHQQFEQIDQHAFEKALKSLLEHFHAYRTYKGTPSPEFELACAEIRKSQPGIALDAIVNAVHSEDENVQDAVRRFNQLAAPVAAKAVEDTAFYRYGRLLSRNDVGFSPSQFAMEPEGFIAKLRERQQALPHAMLATATHDHKRGADVRARLAVLSEIPDVWEKEVRSWFDLNAPLRPTAVQPGDEYQLYQTLLGSWPVDVERALGWREKTLREAKLETSWFSPNASFEKANADFLKAILDPQHAFAAKLGAFAEWLAPAAACNGLVQSTLQLTAPGVPDFYQGSELWDLTMVDPDNRRPVDYSARQTLISSVKLSIENWQNGAPKLALIRTLLNLRKRQPEIFEAVIEAVVAPTNIFAFRRGPMAVAVPLHCAASCIEQREPLPDFAGSLTLDGNWRDALCSEQPILPNLDFATVFKDFPVAVLIAA
jgi:(1->4)-alpha-D-glucan 1-alpha-D-glucosylmutase